MYVVITFDLYRQIQLARMLATCARGEGERERKLAGLSVVYLPLYAARSVVTSVSFLRIEGQGSV